MQRQEYYTNANEKIYNTAKEGLISLLNELFELFEQAKSQNVSMINSYDWAMAGAMGALGAGKGRGLLERSSKSEVPGWLYEHVVKSQNIPQQP